MDQGIVNYLVYKNKFECEILFHKNNIMTNIGCDAIQFNVNNEKIKIKNTNIAPAIVHHYDRLPKIELDNLKKLT